MSFECVRLPEDDDALVALARPEGLPPGARGLFRDGSWLRRISAEPVLLFGGGRALLLEIAPDAKDRLPKRSPKKDVKKAKTAAKKAKKASVSPGKGKATKKTAAAGKSKKASSKRLSRKKPR